MALIEGRIRRRTYWKINILCGFINIIIEFIAGLFANTAESAFAVAILTIIPTLFCISAAARRCHDLGHSGWWQLIPFYVLWLAFADSEPGYNEYGANPKEILSEQNSEDFNDEEN